MYTSYSYYYETFRGSQLAPDQWPAAAREAEAYIDLLTCQRLREGSPVTDEVRMAVWAVAEVVGRYRAARASRADGLKSVSNDGYSESYADDAATSAQFSADKLAAADLYLPRSSPLRYAGV